MPLGIPSLRIDEAHPHHHIWLNNGTSWVHDTVHFGYRKRRIRRSLETRELAEALRRRDELLRRLAVDGEIIADSVPTPTPRSIYA